MLDVLESDHFLSTNPKSSRAQMETGGMNLAQGAHDWWRDALATFAGKAGARRRELPARTTMVALTRARCAAQRLIRADPVLAGDEDRVRGSRC